MQAARIKTLLHEAVELSTDLVVNAARLSEIRVHLGQGLPPAVDNVYRWAMNNRPDALLDLFPLFLDYRLVATSKSFAPPKLAELGKLKLLKKLL